MKKNLFSSLLICGTIFTAQAQFLWEYGMNTARGYDLEEYKGNYYYSIGDDNQSEVFMINPTTGHIIDDVNANIKLTITGATNYLGKNSIIKTTASGAGGWTYMPGIFVSGAGQNIWGNGNNDLHAAYLVDAISPLAIVPSHLRSYNFPAGFQGVRPDRIKSYSDQVVYNNHVGSALSHYFTGVSENNVPYIYRRDYNSSTTLLFSEMNQTAPYGQDEVPTRIIEDDANVYVSYGGLTYNNSGGYYNNNSSRNPGIWAQNSSNQTIFNKIYREVGPNPSPSLGNAQSVIMTGEMDQKRLVVVASGDYDPNDLYMNTGEWNSGTNIMGNYTNYFHILKLKLDGSVDVARKIELIPSQTTPDIHGHRVNVGDIIENPDNGNFLITGSFTTIKEVLVGPQTLKLVESSSIFIIEVDGSLSPSSNLLQAKIYHIDGYGDNTKLKANRIKLFGTELFVTGTNNSSPTTNIGTPFILNVKKSDLMLECSEDIMGAVLAITIEDNDRSSEAYPCETYSSQLNKEEDPKDIVDGCGFIPHLAKEDDDSNSGTTSTESKILTTSEYVVSPNPASNNISISGIKSGEGQIIILDLNGRVIFEFNGNIEENHQLNISEFETGMYIMNITQNNQVSTLRFVKE